MKKETKYLVLVLACLTVLVIGSSLTTNVAAEPIIDPGDGGSDPPNDNAIINSGFEDGTIAWDAKSGFTGTWSSTTSKKYEGSKSLQISGTIATGGIAFATVYQSLDPVPITRTTVLGGAMYFDSDATKRFVAIVLHITPADYWLVYYVSDNLDMPDIDGEQYTFDMGSTQDVWKHFYKKIYYDISRKGEDPTSQSIDEIWCHVRTESWWWHYIDAYFDDLYLGSTPPSLTIADPVEDQWIRGKYTFSGTAVDNRGEGFNGVYFMVDPGLIELAYPFLFWTSCNGTSSWTAEIDTTELTDGEHIAYFYVVDATGTRTRESITFRVDNESPTITISSPSPYRWVSGTITVSGIASDGTEGSGLLKVIGRIGTGSWVDAIGTSSWKCSIDTTEVDDGTRFISIGAYDYAGNFGLETFPVRVDNTDPVIGTISFSPTYGSSGTTFTIKTAITESGSGISKVTAVVTDPAGNDFTVSLSTETSSGIEDTVYREGGFTLEAGNLEGTYTIKNVTVIDVAGNVATKTSTASVIFDSTAPILEVTSHSDLDTVSGSSIDFSGKINGSVAGISSFTVSIDGNDAIDISFSGTSWTYSWPTTGIQDGYHHFRFVATDNAGNTKIVNLIVLLRNEDDYVAPFIPVVDQYGNYIGYARATIGDSQLVLVFNVPNCDTDTELRFMIAPPYDDMWSLEDISYVDGSDTISFVDDPNVIWDTSAHALRFPVVTSTSVSLIERSVIVSVGKADLVWTLETPVDYDIVLGVTHSVTLSLSDSQGIVPPGLPFEIELHAVQGNENLLLSTATIANSGQVTIYFSIGLSSNLVAGPVDLYIVILNMDYPLYDVTKAPSSNLAGFTLFEEPSWLFDPADAVIVHYVPTVYDQRQLTVQVTMLDSYGLDDTMIGQLVEVTITGPNVNTTIAIYQTLHEDGVYALFKYNLTEAGEYTLLFDYVPSGYYLDIANSSLTVSVEGQRPVNLTLDIDDGITPGLPIVLAAELTDAWASGYPIEGLEVTFSYTLDDQNYVIGISTTDGFGLAYLTWDPSYDDWLQIAGKDIQFQVETNQTISYLNGVGLVPVSIPTISTSFNTPFLSPTLISAGESITVNIHLYDVFMNTVSAEVLVQLSGTSGYYDSFVIVTEVNGSFVVTLDTWGNYTMNLSYAGSEVYASSQISQGFTVNGLKTFTHISSTPESNQAVAGEDILIEFQVVDIHGVPVADLEVLVNITWNGATSSYTFLTEYNNSILLHPDTNGDIVITCVFLGQETYEPSSSTSVITIIRRSTIVTLDPLPDVIHPYVSPSEISYTLTSTVTDNLTGLPMADVTVLYCYVLENQSVFMPIWNMTGSINETLASEFLAWGIFTAIGTAVTDSSGTASFVWQAPVIPIQDLTIFALSFRNDVHETGISEVQVTSYQLIDTSIQVEASWRGDATNVNVSIRLWDEYGFLLLGEYVEILIRSAGGNDVFEDHITVLTGVNSTFVWSAPNYGMYIIECIYRGSQYYDESASAPAFFVVSWRLLDVQITAPSSVYAFEDIIIDIYVVDLNATENELLLEPITVHLVRRVGLNLETLGSVVVDGHGMGQITWSAPPHYETYRIFAIVQRSEIYEAAMSNILAIRVDPIRTTLSIDVEDYYECALNFTYVFDIDLVDEFGNSLDGAIVSLTLTDNYTEFWSSGFNARYAKHSPEAEQHLEDLLWHTYEFTIIIGLNDTFTLTLDSRAVDRILFAARAIAIAEYDGNTTYLPSMDLAKMASHLIQTSVEIGFENDNLRMFSGGPQLIYFNVSDEIGDTIYRGYVNVTIIGPDGYIFEYQVDLSNNNTLYWTPSKAGQYSIHAEFLGGTVPLRVKCQHGGGQIASGFRWVSQLFYNMRMTRSMNVSTMLVSHIPVTISFGELPKDIYCDDSVLLQANVVNSLNGQPVAGFSVRFFYFDETGEEHFLGANTTNSEGIAILLWNTPRSVDSMGYQAVLLGAEGSSKQYQGMTFYAKTPIRLWPKKLEAPDYVINSANHFGTDSSSVDSIFAAAIVVVLLAASVNFVRLNPQLRKFMFLCMAILLTVGMLYVSLALESYNHPFEANLLSNLQTNFDGVSAATDAEDSDIVIANGYTPESITFSRGMSDFGITYNTLAVEEAITPTVTTAPNATYIIVPLRRTLDVSFVAQGKYVVTILDAARNPVDTVAGIGSGLVNVSFRISESKYIPGKSYTVNTFVTAESGGIIYGDTSWITMVVSKVATTLEILLESETIQYYSKQQTISLAAQLSRMYENISLPNGDVTFYYRPAQNLTWTEIGTATTSDTGIASLDWTLNLPKGSYVINATYEGDANHDSAVTLKLLTVEGAATVVSPAAGHATQYWTEYAHPVTLYSSLYDYYGMPLENRTLDFYLRRDDATHWIGQNKTNSEGVAELVYTPYLVEGTHGVEIRFEGDANYAPSSLLLEDALSVLRQSSRITDFSAEKLVVTGHEVILDTRIEDGKGYPLYKKPVLFQLYDSSTQTWRLLDEVETDVSGYASVNYMVDLSPGKYAYRIAFDGDEMTLPVATQGTLTVLPESTEIYLVHASAIYGHDVVISAHLQDTLGLPIESEVLLFYIQYDNIWVPMGWALTSADGWADLTWNANLPAGNYTVKVVFPGTLAKSSAEHISTSLTIRKSNSVLSVSAPSQASISLPVEMNVTLTDELGLPLGNRDIELTISHEGSVVQSVTLQTDTNGIASYRYIPPYLGEYIIQARFVGDDHYGAAISTDTMVAEKIDLAISLVLSQVAAHRNDIIAFSGFATRYDPDLDAMVPVESGVTFYLNWTDDLSLEIVSYEMETYGTNGQIRGTWTIPTDSISNPWVQAGNRTFIVSVGKDYIYSGSTEFDLRIIERTSLTITPERDSKPVDDFYVEQSTDFRFVLFDEDNEPLIGFSLDYSINGEDFSGITESRQDGNGLVHLGYHPKQSGGLYVRSSYEGSIFFDPVSSRITETIWRRDVTVDSIELSTDYAHRGDTLNLSLSLIDDLTNADLIETITLDVLVDGTIIQSFNDYSGFDKVTFTLPDDLQAGEHTVQIGTHLGRVYNVIGDSLTFICFEYTTIEMFYPDNMKSLEKQDIRIKLTDEDGAPLPKRFIELSIENPENELNILFLETDNFGEAHYSWTPQEHGDFVLESAFDGEVLFLVEEVGFRLSTTVTVAEGGGKSESGISPLWVLPVILLLAVDIALEFTSFGCLAFLMADAKAGDTHFNIKKIAYPSIRIVNVDIWLPIIGWTTVPVPIPYIYNEFNLKITSPTLNFELGGGSDTDTIASFNGRPLSAIVDDLIGVFENPVVESQSTYVSPNTLVPSSPEAIAITTESGSIEGGDIQIDSPRIEITNINEHDVFENQETIEVRWALYLPEFLGEINSTIAVDGGDPIEVEPDTSYVSSNGAILYYRYSLQTVEESGFLNRDALRNGAHKVEVQSEVNNEELSDTVHFYVWNLKAFLVALLAFFGGVLLTIAIESLVGKIWARNAEKMPWWAAGLISGILGGIFTGLNVLLVLFFIELSMGISGSSFLTKSGGPFPWGVWIAFGLIALGIIFIVNGFRQAPNAKMETFIAVFTSTTVITVLSWLISEFIISNFSTGGEIIASMILTVLQGLIAGVVAVILLDRVYKNRKGQTGYTSKEMQYGMLSGSIGVGLILGAISLILRTCQEVERENY